ncbi:MAG: ATP-binding protein [Anaerolineae bacterium]
MTIRRRLLLGSVISAGLALVLFVVILISSRVVAEQNQERAAFEGILKAVSELDILTYEYLLHHEPRAEEQWRLRYGSIEPLLDAAQGTSRDDSLLIARLYANLSSIGNAFSHVVESHRSRQRLIQTGASQDQIDAVSAVEDRWAAQLMIASQSMISDASTLSERSAAELLGTQTWARDLALFATFVLLTGSLTISLATVRTVTRSFRRLHQGTEGIGKGDLDYRIDLRSKDEFGSLARSFDAMAAQLQATTVSRDGLAAEVAARRLAEAERERLHTILEATPDMVSYATADGQVMYMNQAGREVLGIQPDAPIEGRSISAGHPDWARQILAEVGIPTALRDGVWVGDTAVLRHDGTEVPVSQLVLAHRDAQGQVSYLSTICRDMTERRRAEQILRESEARRKVAEAVETERQRLFDVLETLPTMVCLLTPDYQVAFANRSFRKQFGESHGRHCYEYCYGRAEPCEFCESYTVLETGQPHHWEVITSDGIIVDVHDFPFTDVDGSPMILEMDIDITEQRHAQEALIQTERLTAIGRMAASLAHEINNPIQSVVGCLGLAIETLEEGEDATRFLDVALEESERAARIVHRMRDLGRSEEGHKELAGVGELLEKVLVLTDHQAHNQQVEVTWEEEDGLPPVSMVRDRIQQVFLNLVLNALEAMPEGGKLHVRAGHTEEPAGVEVSFADTGAGIAPQEVARLFEAFHSTKQLGLGLGLYVSRNILQEHGGRIDVQSEVGQGATFTVWLPVEGG